MNNNPSISILMPMHNASIFLFEALDSVLQQTFHEFEILVVDDGSTDNSIEIVKSYCDRRIRLIENTHDFISSLNKGIDASVGKYIARMDADDLMLPNRIEIQYQFMETNPDIDICGSYADAFGEMKGIMKRPVNHVDIVSSLLQTNPLMHPTIMMKRSIFQQSGFHYKYGYPCAEDYKLWTDLALRGFKFANIPELLIRYRISPQQVTRTSRKEMFASSSKIGLEYAETVIEQMIGKEIQYASLLNSLIKMFNNDLITSDVFLKTLFPLYRNFLQKHTIC